MDVIKIIVIAISGCVFTVVLNQYKQEYSLFVRLAVILLIGITVFNSFAQVSADITDLADGLKINSEYILTVIKALIISVVFGIVSDICSDTGNRAIATCVELAGKLSIMLLAIPFIVALTSLAQELIMQ